MNSTTFFLLSLLAFSFGQTLLDTIQADPRLTTLSSAIQASGLDVALADETTSFTVFAPSDTAFQTFPQAELARLLEDPEQLSQLLLGHVVPEVITSTEIENNQLIASQASFPIRTNVYDVNGTQIITVNGAVVEEADIAASNGVIHIIDRVMSFQTSTIGDIIQTDPQFSQLRSVIDVLALEATLMEGNYTVFAPTDEAFAALAEGVNVSTLAGQEAQVSGPLEIEGVQIVRPDILAANGVIHGLGGFMIPNFDVLITLRLVGASQVVELLEVTGLNETVAAAETLTIFAPTDEAIQQLGVETLQQLKQNPELLTQILLCHTLDREVFSTDFEDDLVIEEREGCLLRLNIYEGENETIYSVNGVEVVQADINATNGVVHVVSRVLPIPQRTLPEALEDLGLTFLASAFNRFAAKEGITGQLEGITLFAPTNEAFSALSTQFQNSIQENPVLLAEVLNYHISPRTWFAVGLMDNSTVQTLREEPIDVSIVGETITLNGDSQVILGDQIITNGVIHVVDAVLLPEGFRMAPFHESSAGVTQTISFAAGILSLIAAILF